MQNFSKLKPGTCVNIHHTTTNRTHKSVELILQNNNDALIVLCLNFYSKKPLKLIKFADLNDYLGLGEDCEFYP
jgi:hypothetical protein